MKLKVYSISILSLLSLCIGGVAFVSLSNDKADEVEASSYSTMTVPRTNINLNDSSEAAIRSYYSNLLSLSESERQGTNLLKNLKPILKNNQKYLSYGSSATTAVWQAYEIVDRDWELSPAEDIDGYNSTTKIISNYSYGSGISTNKGTNPYIHALYVNRNATNNTRAWDDHSQTNYGFNQEHIWAKSCGFEDNSPAAGARGDLMHLWAGNGRVNGQYHSNYYYGYVDKTRPYDDAGSDYSYLSGNLKGFSASKGGNVYVFEPQTSDKGDIARAIFYMAARYNYLSGSDSDGIDAGNPNLEIVNNVTSWSNSGYQSTEVSTGKMGILQDLLEWNRLDPPDEWEIHRNNILYRNFTNNRNPFIDFPEWAEYIWGKSTNGTYNSTVTGSANPSTDIINDFGNGSNTPVSVTVSLSSNSLSVLVGGTANLTANASNGGSYSLNFASSNTSIATVSTNSANTGTPVVITGVAIGTATITVSGTIDNKPVNLQCSVNVTNGSNVTIGTSDYTSGYASSGTAGTIQKSVISNNDLSISYSGINTQSSGGNTYSYTMYVSNKGYIYSTTTPSGYYPSRITVSFSSSTGETGKIGASFSNSVISERDSSVNGSVTKSGTYSVDNNDSSKIHWNLSTNGSNVQITSITVTYSPTSKILSSISITGQTTTFTKGDTFAFGGTVTATYSDGSTKNVTGSASFTGYNMQTAGSQTVTVSYVENGVTKTTTYQITVNEPQIALSSISLTTTTVKTEYKVGETFSSDGLIVTAKYSDNSTKDVTDSVTFSGYDLSSTGVQTVVVSYTEEGVTKTASYNILVSNSQTTITLTGIAVTTQPAKTEYIVNDVLDTTGMVVTATYSDGSSMEITGYTLSSPDMSTAGEKTITVTYQGKTATFTVTVSEPQPVVTLSSIAITTQPTKTVFEVGDSFDTSGLVVTATYSDGTTKDVTSSVSFSGYNMQAAGTQTVTVSYVEDGVTKTAAYQITVNEPVTLSSIAITTQPTKTEYLTGEDLDTTGMVVTATYSDGSSMEITGYTLSSPDMSTAGEKTITVTYQRKTATFTINVADALKEQKDAAIQELNDYYNSFNLSNYTLENISGLLAELKAGEEAIRAATSEGEINIALANAKARMAAIPKKESNNENGKTCGGNIAATSVILSAIALTGAALLIYKKKKIK